MDEQMKEVYFDEYCRSCEHFHVAEHEDQRNECLSNLSNVYSHKPVKYTYSKDIDTDNWIIKNYIMSYNGMFQDTPLCKELSTWFADLKFEPDKEKLEILRVVFNGPATIVFWSDKTKTVVKCGKRDKFDPEKGLAMAIVKKMFGNKGNYYNIIKKSLDTARFNGSDIDGEL